MAIEKKITTAVFEPGSTTANVYGLWQYDYGQVLRIQGLHLPSMVEIHFSLQETGGTSVMRVGVTKDGVTDVIIPDSMLENDGATSDYDIFAFVYLTDATSGQTEYKIKLRVKSRPEPEVPGGGEDPDIFHEAVQAVRKSADKAAESEKQAEGWAHGREDLPERAQDNAKYYSDQTAADAKKTGTDRKEVERLVESVSGIDEQVVKVENLTKQAQTSATNAALSEQAAKTAETNAQTAQAGAETAEGNAELAERNAKVSEQAVEKAKQLVTQMGQDVLDNKNHVDQTTQAFTLTAQQAVADVNNAGQAQTERAQSVGNTAVESVKTAQTKAVEAVQTEGITQTGNVSAEGAKQVQAVQDKGEEVLQSIPEDFTAQMESKLDKNQGIENAGKSLVVGEDGNVIPGRPYMEGTGATAPAIVLDVSGEVIIVNDSSDRAFQGMEIFGKSTQNTESGEVSPDHPVEIESVGTKGMIRVNVFGANIINFPEGEAKNNGITYTSSKGAVKVKGKTESSSSQTDVSALICVLPKKLKGIFYLSGTSSNVLVNIKITSMDGAVKYFGKGKFNLDGYEKEAKVYIRVDPNKSVNETVYPMVNAGDTPLPWEPFQSKPELQISTPDGLPGIPVTSNGNYIDPNGRHWVCDELNPAQGERLNRLKKASLANRQWTQSTNHRFYTSLNDASKITSYCLVLCNCYKGTSEGHQLTNNNQISLYKDSNNTYPDENWLYIRDDTVSTPEEMQQKMNQLNAEIIYITASPTKTTLPQEVMEAYGKLHSNDPVTTIMTDAGAGMKVKYIVDTKKYIDQKIAKKIETVNRAVVTTQKALI